MLAVHCPDHGCEVLVSPGDIESITNTERGMVVRWRCTCGHRGRTVTGPAARRGSSLDAVV